METQDLSKLKIDADLRGTAAKSSRRRRRAIWIILLAAAVFGVLVLALTGRLTPAAEVTAFKVSATFPSRALTVLNASGYVVAQRKAAVSSKATGRLEKLYVEEGKYVREGDILAVLENKDLLASLEEAKASLKVATAALRNAEAELHDATLNYNRQKALRQAGAVSEQAHDTAEARYKKAVASETSARFAEDRAEALIKVAEVNLEYSYIRAPFDGVILTKNADQGEVVAPFGASANAKAAVVTMADPESLMVEVDVSESGLEKAHAGQTTEVRLDAFPNDRFPGKVHMIVPTADRSKATVLTKVKLDKLDPRVLPEMSAKVAFLSRPLGEDEKKTFLGIPLSAVRKTSHGESVFRINDSKAHEIRIKTGRQFGETLEALSGLKEGDIIVFKPDPSLKDGRRVRVKE